MQYSDFLKENCGCFTKEEEGFRGSIIKVEEALELNIVKCNILLHFIYINTSYVK